MKVQIGPEELQLLWNATRQVDWPSCQTLNPDRKGHAIARLRENPDLDEWREAIGQLARDQWWLENEAGSKHAGWRPSFDYMIRPGTLTKLLEKAATWPKIQAAQTEDDPYTQY